ncbi:MAG: hypothetical protein IT221_10170 [Fluviicola sp.]|nr:hypothetical protein [Fluviicola sp.]
MKQLILLFALFSMLRLSAQERQIGTVERPFRFQVYTGGPSILKSAFKLSNTFQDEVTYSGKPLIGLSADYRLLPWLSLGTDISYRYGQMQFVIDDSTLFQEIEDKWDVDVSSVVDPFGKYEVTFPRLRIMVVGTAHFLKPTSDADFYMQMGIGYNRVKPRLYLDDSEIRYFNKIGTLSMPVAYRLALGYGYHFGEHFGAFAEVGLGGPIVSAGASFRF